MIPARFKNFLITGGAGFIGSHIVDQLLNMDKKVIVIDNLSSGRYEFLSSHLSNPNFKFIKGDLLIEADLDKVVAKDIDTVIHLAANPDISRGIIDPNLDFNQTIVATFNLLMWIKKNRIKKIIYFSGSGVYGDIGDMFASESYGPLLPVSMYGASKLTAEALISAFSHLYKIQSWIFRPANIVGSRATHGVVFDFISKLKKNPRRLTILGNGHQSKSYLHINEVLEAVWTGISKSNKAINVFNIASKSFISVNEIAEIVINELGLKNVKIQYTGGKVGWPGDIPVVRIDNKRLNKLGWKAKLDSYSAVKRTVKDLVNEK